MEVRLEEAFRPPDMELKVTEVTVLPETKMRRP